MHIHVAAVVLVTHSKEDLQSEYQTSWKACTKYMYFTEQLKLLYKKTSKLTCKRQVDTTEKLSSSVYMSVCYLPSVATYFLQMAVMYMYAIRDVIKRSDWHVATL